MADILLPFNQLTPKACYVLQQASVPNALYSNRISAIKKIEHIGNNAYFCKVCRTDLKNMVSPKGKDIILS